MGQADAEEGACDRMGQADATGLCCLHMISRAEPTKTSRSRVGQADAKGVPNAWSKPMRAGAWVRPTGQGT